MPFLRIVLASFRFVSAPSITASTALGLIWLASGKTAFLPVVFWAKIACTGLIFFYVFHFQNRSLFFFHNLGYSRWHITLLMLAADGLLTIILFSIVSLLL